MGISERPAAEGPEPLRQGSAETSLNPLRGDFFCGEIFPPGKGCIPLPRVPSWVFVSEEGRDAPLFQWVMVGVLAKLPKSL